MRLRIRIRGKALRRLAVFAICLLLMAASLIAKGLRANSLDSQLEAQRWGSGNNRYTQLTAFISASAAVTKDNITSFRSGIDDALTAAAIGSEDSDARLWLDAYSAETTLNVSTESKSVSARTFAVGGDWFDFHRPEMMSGWYFSKDDVMEDQVVLDRELAWALYGGFELSGMKIMVNGYPCVIVGVCQTPSNSAEKEAYGSAPTMYVSYDLLSKIGVEASITCYEAALPNPVTDFGKGIFTSAVSLGDGNCETVENTFRYSLKSCFTMLSNFGKRSQRINTIYFPYWENAAIYVESWCALFTAAAILFALYPVIAAIILLVYLFRRRKLLLHNAVQIFRRYKQKRLEKQEKLEDSKNEEKLV